MRDNGAGHAGPVRMRLLGAPDGVVLLDDRAGKSGIDEKKSRPAG